MLPTIPTGDLNDTIERVAGIVIVTIAIGCTIVVMLFVAGLLRVGFEWLR
jgi:hypothetical protein